jgi:hypothetical protein
MKIKILKFGKDITSISARNFLNQYYIQRKTLSEERSYIRRAEKSYIWKILVSLTKIF